jgi:branched-chain amino acid transport system permease protein
MGYYLSVLTFTAITVVAILSIYVITGLTGMFSLGQASFMAVGAYASGVLSVRFGLPLLPALGAAIVAGLFFGLIVGLPTVRLRRDYIALVTFGFGEAIIAVLNNTTSVTGGAMGLVGIPQRTTFFGAVAAAVIATALVRNFKYSRFGRQCIAVKNDQLAAGAMGIPVNRVKLLAFLFAAALTASAGALYGSYTTYVEPSLFQWTTSAEWIIIVFVGGINSLTGAIVAAVFLTGLPEFLRSAAEWRIVIYSVIVLIIINFRPSGIFGEYELPVWGSIRNLLARLRRGPRRDREIPGGAVTAREEGGK